MKKRSREINIFSMSALDLFASALGAFILITVVLFPYFPNISPQDPGTLRVQLREAKQQLAKCQATLGKTQTQLQQCRAELRRKFLLVIISWGKKDDVDLHIIDPNGNKFYYKKRSYQGSEAKFEEDSIRGPGNEIWLHPHATPGQYKIYYHLFHKRSTSVTVRGAMLTPDGRTPIPDRKLNRNKQKPLVATITVDTNGNATLQTH